MKGRKTLLLMLLACAAVLAVFAAASCAKEMPAPVVYSLNYTAEEGGFIVGNAEQKVEEGCDGTEVKAVAAEGYRFTGWSDGSTQATRKDTQISADKTLSAKFSQVIYYSLHYAAEEGGFIVGNAEQKVEEGCDGTEVKAVAAEGYRFTGWSDGSTQATRKDTQISADKTLSAKFEKTFNIKFITANSKYGSLVGECEQTVAAGALCAPVRAVPRHGYKFIGWSDGETAAERSVTANEDVTLIANFAIEMLSLPILQIDTLNAAPILDKENYVTCSVSVTNADYGFEFSPRSAQIKGRGNTTWTMPKKPYKLKFDEKIDLFGHGQAKKWTLLADYADKSLLRNRLAFAVGDVLELEYNNTSQPVELYLNGEYMGEYIVCEQTETGTNRVEINDDVNLEDQGFLIELDGHLVEDFYVPDGILDRDWFILNDIPYGVKGPDTEDLDDSTAVAVTAKIKKELSTFWGIVKSGDYAQIEQKIDVESFAKTYIVAELFKQQDVSASSWYLYYAPGGKLKSGPIWDYDLSVSNVEPAEILTYETIWATQNEWYKELLKNSEFVQLVAQLLNDNQAAIRQKIIEVVTQAKACSDSYLRNFVKWDELLGYPSWPSSPSINDIDTWEGQVDFVVDFLNNSLDFMLSQYPVT